MEESREKSLSWQTKVFYGVMGIIIFTIITYLYNSRGGRFLVYACNETTNNCYTIEADLERETLASPNAKLYFSNGGSLDIYCEEEFGCSSDEGDSWSIRKINRL